MTLSAPILETDRLRLRPHQTDDFDPIARLFDTPRSQFIGGPLPAKRVWHGFAADVGQWVLMGFGAWAIELRETGEFVGQVGLNKPVHFPEIELGWLVFDGHEGKGYATEAALAARDWGYANKGWQTLVSYIDLANYPSIRVAERLGAQPDRSAALPDGETPDETVVYRHLRPSEAA